MDHRDRVNIFGIPFDLGKFDINKMQFTFEWEDEEGDIHDITLPCKWEVCTTCRGRGSHVNPSIDSEGITDWSDWSFEDRETYMSGGYDVQCYECKGRTTSPIVDSEACYSDESRLNLQRYQEMVRSFYESAREQEAEMKWGH